MAVECRVFGAARDYKGSETRRGLGFQRILKMMDLILLRNKEKVALNWEEIWVG